MTPQQESILFRVLTTEEEKESRQWARDNWEHGTTINPLWHPVVRAECAQIQAEYPALLKVAENETLARGVHSAVVDAIIKAWPPQAVVILREIKLNGDHYFFRRWGMYVGIEFDGYIHT